MSFENINQSDFKKNNEALNNLLLNSETGKSAEEWKAMIFPTLTADEVKERDEEKDKLFKEWYKRSRKSHRPDLD